MEAIINRIVAELTVCFIQAGRNVDGRIDVLAASLEDALNFNSVDEVIEAFKRAKMLDVIPNQKSLYEALRNYREEVLKYRKPVVPKETLEYSDSREGWIPKSESGKRVNYFEAVKNYCIALGKDMYDRYVSLHVQRVDEELRGGKKIKVLRWIKPAERFQFDREIEGELKVLYKRYLRNLPRYATFPEGAPMNLAMKPPMVHEFRLMIEQYRKDTDNGYQH